MWRRILLLVVTTVLATGSPAAWHQRDAGSPQTVALATVEGVVTTADANAQPLRRAIVTVKSTQPVPSRSAITDDAGRFVIRGVAPGRVFITASKRGYVSGAYGSSRPGRAGTPVELAADQTFAAPIALSRAAVMTGTIRDEHGAPLAGLRVFALDARQPEAPSPSGGRSAGDSGLGGSGVLTDDRGVYRIFDLAPGEYIVAAVPTTNVVGEIVRRSGADNDRLLAALRERQSRLAGQTPVRPPAAPSSTPPATLAAMFFPGTASLTSATRIKVVSGDVREGIDFAVRAVPVTTIEGVVVSDGGLLPASLQMRITPEDTVRFFALAGANPQLVQPPGADGRFKYSTITPGHYVISIRADSSAPVQFGRGAAALNDLGRGAGAGSGQTADTMYALEEIDVSGQPVSGVALRLRRGSRVAGKLVIDASTLTPPADLTTVRIALQASSSGYSTISGTVIGGSLAASQAAPLRADGTFEFVGVAPGRYTVQTTVPAASGSGWWLRSAVVGGRDVLDAALNVTLGADIAGAALTLTDRRAELSGTLQSAAGLPAPEYFVIVMPADPAMWVRGSRRVKTTRPASDGRFSIADLPAGDYLLVALTDVVPNEWQQPEFLASIAPAGVKVAIAEGEKKVQDLRIAGR